MRLDPITLHDKQRLIRNVVRCNSQLSCVYPHATQADRHPRSLRLPHPQADPDGKTVSIPSPRIGPRAPLHRGAREQPAMPDDHSAVEPPLPIPNRTVKRRSADDSEHLARESRTSSGTHDAKKPPLGVAFLFAGGRATWRSSPATASFPGARCEASIGCCGCSPGVILRDWESPNPHSAQRHPDEHP